MVDAVQLERIVCGSDMPVEKPICAWVVRNGCLVPSFYSQKHTTTSKVCIRFNFQVLCSRQGCGPTSAHPQAMSLTNANTSYLSGSATPSPRLVLMQDVAAIRRRAVPLGFTEDEEDKYLSDFWEAVDALQDVGSNYAEVLTKAVLRC
eukprot:1497859-Amphidinium_carterae.1